MRTKRETRRRRYDLSYHRRRQLKSIFRRSARLCADECSVAPRNSLDRVEMWQQHEWIVICLILYAFFQFYQVYSSFTTIFLDEQNNLRSHKYGTLTAINIVGFSTSSILLIVGSLKSKPWMLMGALSILLAKLGFILWYIERAYNLTLGCGRNCPPGHIVALFKHLAIIGERELSFPLILIEVFHSCSRYSSLDCDYRAMCRFDSHSQIECIKRKETSRE